MNRRKIWTEADVRALGLRVDGLTAVMIVYGVGRTRGYQILRSGMTDFRVIKVPGSNRYVVPVAEIIRLMFGDTASADAVRATGTDPPLISTDSGPPSAATSPPLRRAA